MNKQGKRSRASDVQLTAGALTLALAGHATGRDRVNNEQVRSGRLGGRGRPRASRRRIHSNNSKATPHDSNDINSSDYVRQIARPIQPLATVSLGTGRKQGQWINKTTRSPSVGNEFAFDQPADETRQRINHSDAATATGQRRHPSRQYSNEEATSARWCHRAQRFLGFNCRVFNTHTHKKHKLHPARHKMSTKWIQLFINFWTKYIHQIFQIDATHNHKMLTTQFKRFPFWF